MAAISILTPLSGKIGKSMPVLIFVRQKLRHIPENIDEHLLGKPSRIRVVAGAVVAGEDPYSGCVLHPAVAEWLRRHPSAERC